MANIIRAVLPINADRRCFFMLPPTSRHRLMPSTFNLTLRPRNTVTKTVNDCQTVVGSHVA